MSVPMRHVPAQLASLTTIEAEVKYDLGAGGRVPSLEGPVFDREGNFYCCRTGMNNTFIKKITPDGEVSDFCHITEGMVIGLAFHKDGRMFATDMVRGSLRQISPSGEILCETLLHDETGASLRCDCMVFDEDGSLFMTDLRGTICSRGGGIWKLTPEDNYQSAKLVLGNMASPNGIVMSRSLEGPRWDSDALWIGESASNSIIRVCLSKDHEIEHKQYSPIPVFNNPGKPNIDTICMDDDGNIYAAVMFGGRVVVLDSEGTPLFNVLVPGFRNWKLQYTPNLVIHPKRPECYLLASDDERAVVLIFPALAKSQKLFANL